MTISTSLNGERPSHPPLRGFNAIIAFNGICLILTFNNCQTKFVGSFNDHGIKDFLMQYYNSARPTILKRMKNDPQVHFPLNFEREFQFLILKIYEYKPLCEVYLISIVNDVYCERQLPVFHILTCTCRTSASLTFTCSIYTSLYCSVVRHLCTNIYCDT